METEVLKEQHYVEELVEIIRSGLPKEELIDRLSDYHEDVYKRQPCAIYEMKFRADRPDQTYLPLFPYST